MLLLLYVKNEDADQPAHLHSLTSTFDFLLLESKSNNFTCYTQYFNILANLCRRGGWFQPDLVSKTHISVVNLREKENQ